MDALGLRMGIKKAQDIAHLILIQRLGLRLGISFVVVNACLSSGALLRVSGHDVKVRINMDIKSRHNSGVSS